MNLEHTHHPDEPLPLSDAIQAFYPHSGLTVSTLRTAIRKGALEYYHLSKAFCVTKNQLDKWMASCLRNKSPQDCGPTAKEESISSSTSSTESACKSAQAALLAKLEKQKQNGSSQSIPAKSTKRESANIHLLSSR